MKHRQRLMLIGLVSALAMALVGCSESASSADKKIGPAPSAEYAPQVGDVIFQSSGHTALVDMIEGASGSH